MMQWNFSSLLPMLDSGFSVDFSRWASRTPGLTLAGVSVGTGPTTQELVLAAAGIALVAVLLSLIAIALSVRTMRRPKIRSESLAPAPYDLPAMMRDAEELAQRIAAELDARAAKLERLIARADQISARAEQELSTDERRSRTRATPPAEGEPRMDTARASNNSSPHATLEYTHQWIYALADEGLSPIDIARRTNQTAGQIELILSLRKMKGAAERE